MQILYAAPFVLISILAFIVCLIFPGFRRFAVPTLAAPVTFGICSISGWIAFALIENYFTKVHLRPYSGIYLLVQAIAFYLLPGLAGSAIAVYSLLFLQRRYVQTPYAKAVVLSCVSTLVAFPIGAVIGLSIASPQTEAERALWISFLLGVLASLGVLAISVGVYKKRQKHEALVPD